MVSVEARGIVGKSVQEPSEEQLYGRLLGKILYIRPSRVYSERLQDIKVASLRNKTVVFISMPWPDKPHEYLQILENYVTLAHNEGALAVATIVHGGELENYQAAGIMGTGVDTILTMAPDVEGFKRDVIKIKRLLYFGGVSSNSVHQATSHGDHTWMGLNSKIMLVT